MSNYHAGTVSDNHHDFYHPHHIATSCLAIIIVLVYTRVSMPLREVVRYMTAAGEYFPKDKSQLSHQLHSFFPSGIHVRGLIQPKAIIVPHGGYLYSGHVAAAAYQAIGFKAINRILLIGKSHHSFVPSIVGSSATIWQTPFGDMDQVRLINLPFDDPVHQEETCLELQLPFIHTVLPGKPFTALLTGGDYTLNETAKLLEHQITADSLLIIVSDLSTGLSSDNGLRQDKQTLDAILHHDWEYIIDRKNTVCNPVGVATLMIFARLFHWHPKLIKYDSSANTYGKHTNVTGYASLIYY